MGASLTILSHFSAARHEMATLTVNQMFLMLKKKTLFWEHLFVQKTRLFWTRCPINVTSDTVTFLGPVGTELTGC